MDIDTQAERIDSLPELETRLREALFARDPATAARTLEALEAKGAKDANDSTEPGELTAVFRHHPAATLAPVWERLPADVAGTLLAALDPATATDTLDAVEPVRLAAALATLESDERQRLVALAPPRSAREIREALTYPPDRAGALMDARVPTLRGDHTVAEAASRLRRRRRVGRAGVFVVDADGRLAGWVEMQDLALAEPADTVGGMAREAGTAVNPFDTREEVARVLEQRPLSDVPVVDLDGRLLGAIDHASALQAEKDSATVGMQTMVGVGKDERALSTTSFAVRRRLPWLHVNLLTAFAAAAVVGLFAETIAQFTALAILLPIVAGQSGNTGAQALAVTMRGLALREIRAGQWRRVVAKETSVGFWNGLAVAGVTAAAVFAWSASDGLALIIAVSMTLSMVVAGIAGAGIPIALRALGQDPAQSSSIVLTTITDVTGFLSFLGIATLLAALI